jgi:hypothetical protein
VRAVHDPPVAIERTGTIVAEARTSLAVASRNPAS